MTPASEARRNPALLTLSSTRNWRRNPSCSASTFWMVVRWTCPEGRSAAGRMDNPCRRGNRAAGDEVHGSIEVPRSALCPSFRLVFHPAIVSLAYRSTLLTNHWNEWFRPGRFPPWKPSNARSVADIGARGARGVRKASVTKARAGVIAHLGSDLRNMFHRL